MLWFGLRAIKGRFVLDVLTLAMLLSCSLKPTSSPMHMTKLLLSWAITISTAGLTARWTISFPMIPIILLQSSLYCLDPMPTKLAAKFVKVISVVLVLKSALLTILFPATEMAPVQGKYNVGVVDLHLPVEGFEREHVTARILYPTDDVVGKVPYLNADTNNEICKEMMGLAPPPLHKLNWMLNSMKLSKIPASRNGAPLNQSPTSRKKQEAKENEEEKSSSHKLPIAIFSHGLTGNAVLYSFQTMSLAASGTVVLSLDHTDGSAIGVKHHDGSFRPFDRTVGNLEREGKITEHVRARRAQADYRARELLAAAQALKNLNEKNIDELENLGISFVSKLNTDDFTVMGHSFGAATAITAAVRKTSWFSCCIAHDPATDWMPDDARRQLFANERFKGSDIKYEGGTAGYETEATIDNKGDAKDLELGVHSLNLLFLYSNEFASRGWGGYEYVRDLHKRSQLGPRNGVSDIGYIYKAQHSEFSDMCMKLPLWLTRLIGMTGPRNPIETAEEISFRSLEFIENVRQRQHSKAKEE